MFIIKIYKKLQYFVPCFQEIKFLPMRSKKFSTLHSKSRRKNCTLYIYSFHKSVKYRERRRKNRKRDERSWASFTNSPRGTHRGEKRAVKVGPWPYCTRQIVFICIFDSSRLQATTQGIFYKGII